MSLRIKNPFSKSEDFAFYEKVYGTINYKGKTVLDFGADVGSTADYFLQKGAEVVYAIEGEKRLFDKLKINVLEVFKDPTFQHVKPWLCRIENHEIIAGIIYQANPDIVKFDLDSTPRQYYEDLLCKLPDKVLQRVHDWLIECHTRQNHKLLAAKFVAAGFQEVRDVLWAPPNTSVVYFKVPD